MSLASATATPLSLEAIAFVPRFAMALCSGKHPAEGALGERLRAELAVSGVLFEPAEGSTLRIVHGELTIGRACFLTPAAARERFGDSAPFLAWKPACPFLGDVVGYLAWDQFVMPDPPERRGAFTDLVRGLIAAGASFICRLDTARIVELSVERALPLDELTDRWGFGDGDLLLTRADSAYARDACRSAEAAIAALGFRGEVEWVPTSHSPLRLAWHELPSRWRKRVGFEPRRIPALYDGAGQALSMRALRGKSFSIWTLNVEALRDLALWARPRPAA